MAIIKSPSQIKSSAQKEYYDLINGFRQWLGPNTSLTIDRETKEEYTWKEVITFDDNVRENHKSKLIKAISSTALIKDQYFYLPMILFYNYLTFQKMGYG